MPQDPNSQKQVFTAIIKKQMMLLGPQAVLPKVQNIDGLKVATDGTVMELTKPGDTVLEQILSLFTDFSGRIAAKDIIGAKTAQQKEVKEQIAGGWLQMENEKAKLLAAIDGISLGFITTNESLEILSQNPAVEKILGISEGEMWTMTEIQNAIGNQLYLPIECNKAMENRTAVAPVDVNVNKRRVRFHISPIINVGKEIEVSGVVLLLEDLGSIAEPATQPSDASAGPSGT